MLLSLALGGQAPLEGQLESALAENQAASLAPFFASGKIDDYLGNMASRRGGFKNLEVDVMPAPPGWGAEGEEWAVFHAFQDLEQDHDVVMRIKGGKLTEEVPEHERGGWRIDKITVNASLHPEQKSISATTVADLSVEGSGKAMVARLNAPYKIERVMVDGQRRSVFNLKDGSLPRASLSGAAIRCGSLLVIWDTKPIKELTVTYSGELNTSDHDKISDKVAYVTAWWVPSIARLPHPTDVTITGPDDWVLRSEGISAVPKTATSEAGTKTERYICQLPISFPKIIAGRYTLAAQKQSNGKTFRAYHLDPVEPERAQRDVELMADAEKFFSDNLVPYPFPSYECFDADTYYGIESYSYTLLRRSITTRFVTHELMHTWFGGITNSAYSRDTWNEGMTQYVDSVLFANNRDRTLETGFRTAGIRAPLTEMNIAWENGSATYFRGAYVMHMLRARIGPEDFWSGLQAMLKDRVGKDTVWPDLRPYFEEASGEKLDWFWAQWIENGVFPSIKIQAAADPTRGSDYWIVRVTQSGTPKPFRMQIGLRPEDGTEADVVVKEINQETQTFTLTMKGKPELVLFPYTLAREAN